MQLVTVLIHELKLVIGQWSVRGEKTNESCVLKNHLAQLREQFPLLKLITGDAIYATRPLAGALLDENCDYLVHHRLLVNHGSVWRHKVAQSSCAKACLAFEKVRGCGPANIRKAFDGKGLPRMEFFNARGEPANEFSARVEICRAKHLPAGGKCEFHWRHNVGDKESAPFLRLPVPNP